MLGFCSIKKVIFFLVLLYSLSLTSHAAENESVVVSTVELGTLIDSQYKSYPATVVSQNMAKVSAKINAEITSLPLLVGDTVTSGQTIASLDCDIYKLEVEAARAALDMAAEDLSRIKALKNKSVVSAQQLTAASVAQRQASVQHKQAKLRTSYCEIAAPFSGVITQRLAALGDFAAVGMPLLELVQTDNTEVKVLLPVEIANSLGKVNQAEFQQQSEKVAVTLRTVLPVVDQATKTREARFSTSTNIAPGSFGRIVWQTPGNFLPPDMLQNRNDKIGIFIIEGDRAVFHHLPNALVGKPAAIELPATTLVVTIGRHGLQDGQRVRQR